MGASGAARAAQRPGNLAPPSSLSGRRSVARPLLGAHPRIHVPVLVLGMHRSGTSVLTRVVSLLGLEVGDDDLLMGPDPSNESGHWEVTRLTELNDELLGELGGRWSGPPRCVPAELADLADGPWGERARSALASTFRTESWVWKDPRNCLLLPFWRAVVGDEQLSVVLSLRHPVEVAHSLEARNGFGIDYGIALWERHQRAALAGARGLPALVIRYDDLLADPLAVAARLYRALPGTALADHAAVARAVDPGRRHHHTDDSAVELTPEATRLVGTVEVLAGEHEALQVEVPPESPNLQVAFDEHARLSVQEDIVIQQRPLVEEALERRTQVAWLEAQLEDQAHRYEQMRAVRASRAIRRTLDRIPGRRRG